MRPVISTGVLAAPPHLDLAMPVAARPRRGVRPAAPDIPIRLDFPAKIDPVVAEEARQWLVRQIAKRAVEILNAEEPNQ